MNKDNVYKKKHMEIDEQMIHVNKRWCDLKNGQKEFIINSFNHKYKTFLVENNRLPTKDEKLAIINEVYDLVKEKNIWIPFNEVKIHCQGKMHKLNVNFLK